MTFAKQGSTYVKFLNLVAALRQMPPTLALDAVEERLLNMLALLWAEGKKIPVTEAARMEPNTSERTAFRRLKSLHDKGLLDFEVSAKDLRVRFVVPTQRTKEYFDFLDECIEHARESLWRAGAKVESENR